MIISVEMKHYPDKCHPRNSDKQLLEFRKNIFSGNLRFSKYNVPRKLDRVLRQMECCVNTVQNRLYIIHNWRMSCLYRAIRYRWSRGLWAFQFGNIVLTAHLADVVQSLGLMQNPNNLFFRKSLTLHRTSSQDALTLTCQLAHYKGVSHMKWQSYPKTTASATHGDLPVPDLTASRFPSTLPLPEFFCSCL